MKKAKIFDFDRFLFAALVLVLAGYYGKIIPPFWDDSLLAFFASIGTLPVILSAARSVRQKKINVDLLAAVALIVSILNLQWASAVFINLMLTSARILADYTDQKSRQAIKSLLKLRPERVKIKKGDAVVKMAVSKIKKGDQVVIEMGDRIPVDGTIISGEALIDQSSITGESLPIEKIKGDQVLSSTLNVSGSLIISAEKVGKDTTFEKIIRLVEQSQQNKMGIVTMADKFASIYIAASLIGSLILYFISGSLTLVLSVLLVTCADDIAVAIPMAFSAAIGAAARQGIIIKGGAYLEGLAKVKTLLLDKTGTITKGQLRVAKIVPLADPDKDEILRLAAMAEFFSEHPIAKSIIRAAEEKKLSFEKPEDFSEVSGKGSAAVYKNKTIVCGKRKFFEERSFNFSPELNKTLDGLIRKEVGNIMLVGYGKELIGFIVLEDEVRAEVKDSLVKLKNLGVENIVMLTGDNPQTAQKVAQEIRVDAWHADLLPQDKLVFLRKYLKGNGKTAMIGDGVNDAAALALADVGIAMGAIGTDAAIEAADVALMRDDFSEVPRAFALGRSVMKIARQDFFIWAVVNAAGLFLVFVHVLGPQGAAAYNFVTDFFPIANSLRLFSYKV
jgi:heavy metal translocating P-type ATPase